MLLAEGVLYMNGHSTIVEHMGRGVYNFYRDNTLQYLTLNTVIANDESYAYAREYCEGNIGTLRGDGVWWNNLPLA